MKRILIIVVAVLGAWAPGVATAGGPVNGELDRILSGQGADPGARASITQAAREAADAGIPHADIRAIVRGCLERGMDTREIVRFLSLVAETRKEGSSPGPVLNTIEQGIAKGVAAERILAVAEHVQARLRTSQRIMARARDQGLGDGTPVERTRTQEALAAALGAGLTEQEANELAKLAGKNGIGPAQLSRDVEAVVHLKEAGMPQDLAVRFGRQTIILRYTEKRTAMLERAALDMHKEGLSWEEAFSRIGAERHRGDRGMFNDPGRPAAPGIGGSAVPGNRNIGR